MSARKLLSLCIPTNGICEWVFPVLNSIYDDHADMELFEVIVTDNGNNEVFSKGMEKYTFRYPNLIYKKTEAELFLNQIEAFKLAEGELIKFINHRMVLLPGSLHYFMKVAYENHDTKPTLYFLNKMMKLKKEITRYDTFEQFLGALSFYSSWSGGTAIWKKDFEKIDLNKEFNYYFPHMDLIFSNMDKNEYMIDNTILLRELPDRNGKKGNYNLFYAFGVEFLNIIRKLVLDGCISEKIFKKIKNDNQKFLEELYLQYLILQKPCSFDLTDYKAHLNHYYTELEIRKGANSLKKENDDFLDFLGKITHSNIDIVIFGAGAIGKSVQNYLLLHERSVSLFIDNDNKKWKQQIQGIEIYSPKDGVKKYPNAVYIIANAGHEFEIKMQLAGMGVCDTNIIICNNESLFQQDITQKNG